MATTFIGELNKLMATYRPPGGYGIQNLPGFQNALSRASQWGAREATAADVQGMERQGIGREVSRAFIPGLRRFQASTELQQQLIDLMQRHSELAFGQRQATMGLMAPYAWQEANKPSALAKFFGGALGLLGKFGLPALTPNPLAKALETLLANSGGGASYGGGFGSAGLGLDTSYLEQLRERYLGGPYDANRS
ncbi:MAG: hypothetical protein ABT940_03435 [Alphaproteobacteria bacterium]